MEGILQLSKLLFFYPAQLLVLVTAALLLRVQLNKRWGWAVTAVGVLAYFLRPLVDQPEVGDFAVFWRAGCDVLEGVDPYLHKYCLNPPTSLPVFALMGLLPFSQAVVVWLLSILISTVALGYLAQSALREDSRPTWHLPPEVLGVFTTAVALSVAGQFGVWQGQAAALTTVAILLALWARQSDRPVLAGVLLAVATIKVQTMLPFLLLFLRRKDWATWLSMSLACLGLSWLATPLTELIPRLRECLANIAYLSSPGQMNNYADWVCFDMIGFNRALYYLGVQDRAVVQVASLALNLALGTWVAWRVLGRQALPWPAATALVGIFSCAFLYHRSYDAVILALPLVYVVARARQAGPGRWWYRGTILALLGVLYLRFDMIRALAKAAVAPGATPGVLEALILPYPLYLLLAALAMFSRAERCRAIVEWTPIRLRTKHDHPTTDSHPCPAHVGHRTGARRRADVGRGI